MQEDSYAIFVDNSGSVGHSAIYWNSVNQIISEFSNYISHFYLWNSACHACTLKQLENSIKIREGTGGTTPENVANEIVARRFRKIILITDGQVDNGSVQRCDEAFDKAAKQNFKLTKSICYIVNISGAINMSVTCPFTRYCGSEVYKKDGDNPIVKEVSFTVEDYKILDSLEEITLQNFEAKYDLIEGLIIALNMGKTGNIPLKNQLVSMKGRLVKQLSQTMAKEMDFSADMRFSLQKDNFRDAIAIAGLMSAKYYSSDGTMDLEKKISHLINLCGDLRGQFDLGQIKSNKLAIAPLTKEAVIDQSVELHYLSKNQFECPIILDEDVPQILVDECPAFLLGVQKHVVDDIASCPLRILNYPQLKAKFKASLSTFTGVKITAKLLKNPFTQNRLLGAIPLGTHESHVAVGNHTLAKLITGGKMLGNLNLYYAVIWYLINEGEIEYLKPITANATQHLVYRLRQSKTTASLCGLAQFVTTQVSTDVAIWYCVNSGYLNQPTNRDTFRFHCFNIDPMIKMLDVLGYPIHEGVRPHLNRTKILMKLLSKVKAQTHNERKAFKTLFKGLYQNGVFLQEKDLLEISPKFKELEVISTFIPIDGQPNPHKIQAILSRLPKCCRDASLEEIYYLSTLIDPQKSASDIFLDYHIKILPLPKSEINWIYGLNNNFDVGSLRYNSRTMRPHYYVNRKMQWTWQDQAGLVFKTSRISELFSGSHYMEEYVLKYRKMPSHIELLLFFFNRCVESGKRRTLPYLLEEWTQILIERFAEVAEKVHIDEVVDIILSSKTVKNRMFMQAFNSD